MLPGLDSVDVGDLDDFTAAARRALAADGPAVVSVECAADEIPPFAPFLDAVSTDLAEEDYANVVAGA